MVVAWPVKAELPLSVAVMVCWPAVAKVTWKVATPLTKVTVLPAAWPVVAAGQLRRAVVGRGRMILGVRACNCTAVATPVWTSAGSVTAICAAAAGATTVVVAEPLNADSAGGRGAAASRCRWR